MKKPRKPEVVEVRFRLATDATNRDVQIWADAAVHQLAEDLSAKIVKRATVERVGKR